MHGDPGGPRGGDAPVEAAVEVARLDRGSVAGGEDQAGIDPAISRTNASGVLLFLTDLQRGHAQGVMRVPVIRLLLADDLSPLWQ